MSLSSIKNNRSVTLALLLSVAVMAGIDRNAMAVLVEPIKADFMLSDAEMGFLLGPAFVVLYALFGIPFGMWADRGNRRNIITIAISVWSVLTMACGAAIGFFTLALARMGVAVGEAGAHPPGYSMIADLYKEHERGTAMGVFNLSANFGVMIGFILAGYLSDALGWQATFYVLGAPGLLIGLMFYVCVREPDRIAVKQTDPDAPPLRKTAETMLSKKSVQHLVIGALLAAFVSTGYANWMPATLERMFPDMARGTINLGLGLVIGVSGGAGTFLGGYISDKLGQRDVRWRLRSACIAILVGWPIGVTALFQDSYFIMLLLIVPPAFVALFHLASVFALLQELVEPRMRATATAILMLFTNLLGGGLGPQYVGLASDFLVGWFGDMSLTVALASLGLFALWAAFHFFMASRYLVQDLAQYKDSQAAPA